GRLPIKCAISGVRSAKIGFMGSTRLKRSVATGAALMVVAACSPDPSLSQLAPPAKELSTGAGKVLTIAPGQLLAATNGVTPVSFGKPAHGTSAYGADGAM